jgi:dihydroxyacetone kinase
MRAKHFLNDPNALVVSALESFRLTDPSLSVDTDNKILYFIGVPERPGTPRDFE